MRIHIPADLTIVTLQQNGQELPQRWTEAHAGKVFEAASKLLLDRADIEFRLNSCSRVVESMPHGTRRDMVDESGYHFLAAAHRARTGVRVLLVDRVARPELGGQSRHHTRVCLVTYAQDVAATGRILAHELGHLLELPHPDTPRDAGPGQESQTAAAMRNLMYAGALNPAAELTPEQVERARTSELARRFSARSTTP